MRLPSVVSLTTVSLKLTATQMFSPSKTTAEGPPPHPPTISPGRSVTLKEPIRCPSRSSLSTSPLFRLATQMASPSQAKAHGEG